MARLIVTSIPFAVFAVPAQAHWGHAGEVAGHAHWLGIGALVGAAALAAALARRKDAEEKTGEMEEVDAEPDAPEGEAA